MSKTPLWKWRFLQFDEIGIAPRLVLADRKREFICPIRRSVDEVEPTLAFDYAGLNERNAQHQIKKTHSRFVIAFSFRDPTRPAGWIIFGTHPNDLGTTPMRMYQIRMCGRIFNHWPYTSGYFRRDIDSKATHRHKMAGAEMTDGGPNTFRYSLIQTLEDGRDLRDEPLRVITFKVSWCLRVKPPLHRACQGGQSVVSLFTHPRGFCGPTAMKGSL
jgi:hypothetical protein